MGYIEKHRKIKCRQENIKNIGVMSRVDTAVSCASIFDIFLSTFFHTTRKYSVSDAKIFYCSCPHKYYAIAVSLLVPLVDRAVVLVVPVDCAVAPIDFVYFAVVAVVDKIH